MKHTAPTAEHTIIPPVDALRTVPSIVAEQLQDGAFLRVDLGRTDMHPVVPDKINDIRGVSLRLRNLVTTPDGYSYAVIQADVKRPEGKHHIPASGVLVTRLSEPSQGERPGSFVTMTPGSSCELLPEGGNWGVMISLSDDGRSVGILHDGSGATEVLGAALPDGSEDEDRDGLLPDVLWAPPAEAVQAAVLQAQARVYS